MMLLIIISLFSIFQVIPGDIYTSGHEVKELVKFERNLIDSLDTYFRRQKNNGITFDSSITGFVEDKDIKNKDLSSEQSTSFENPLSRFHVTKRLTKDWPVLKENLTCSGDDCPMLTGEDVFKAVFKRENRDLPSESDLEDAALALLHIWDIYDLSIEEIASGRVGQVENDPLSADDIFFIAHAAKDAGKLYAAIKWFEHLLTIQRNLDLSTVSFKLAHIYRKLASAYHEFQMTWKAIEILDLYLKNDPEHKSIAGDLKYFKSSGKDGDRTEVTRYKDENSKSAKDAETYRQLCQLSLKPTNETTLLKCYIKPIFGTYGFSRQEILYAKPRIILKYDVLDNNETKVMLKYTGKEETGHLEPKVGWGTHSKTWTSGSMCEGNPQYPFLHDLSKRIEAITKFKVWPVQDIASSECFEFVYKGIGDESKETKNYWKRKEALRHPYSGNRYVTIRLQLSDVQYGGSTVFPKLGFHLPNIKNSAILLYNLKDDGKPNPNTVHIDCPVIIGANWMACKNMYYVNQYSSRTCDDI